MKVNIYETVEVSDDARKRIAGLLGQKAATRDDLKAFIWKHGQNWEIALGDAQGEEFAVDPTNVNGVGDDDTSLDDLLGSPAAENDEDLI